jgi:outer membrane receptor protein involved in Fe transport
MEYHFHPKLGAIFTCLLLLLISIGMVAQVETGSISGTVKDSTGAVISGATISVKNVANGALRTVTSNQDGLYNVTNLQPGTYQVNVDHSGFAKMARQIVVSVGSKNAADFTMQVGGSSTTVEVVGAGVASVNTETQSLSDVVTPKQLADMPTLNRNPYDLVNLSGNVTTDGSYGATGRGVGVAINGQRAASTNITLDGADNVDEFTASTGQAVPQDSVSEFRVLTSDFSAEYGRASGGVVNVATKSGTNQFHGSAYEYYRGSTVSANTPQLNAEHADAINNGNPDAASIGVKPRFVRNQFGYSIGGPVKKDKLFFFNNTEWARVRSSQLTSYYVPSPEFIAAAAPNVQDFMSQYGDLTGATKVGSVTKDELAANGVGGTSAAYAALPGTMPIWDKVQKAQPSDAGGGAPQNQYMTVARVDYNMTDKTQAFFRYGLQSVDYFPGWASASPYNGFNTGEKVFNNNFLLSVTHVFSPTLVSQSKIVFNRLNDRQPLNGAPTPTMYYKNTGAYYQGDGAALPGYLPFNPGSAIPFGGPQNLAQFYHDVSLTKGRHQFRFGGQYIYTRDNRAFGAYEEAVEQLGGNTNSGLDNFLSGNLYSFKAAIDPQGKQPCPMDFATGTRIHSAACQITLPVTAPNFTRSNRYNDFALYGQDSWKVRPTFTLNLGLRWEYYGVQHNKDPRLDAGFVYGPGSNIFQSYRNGITMLATDPGNPNHGLWKPDYNNFGPRIGFAWDIFGDGKTSLRGGYGISYERNFGNVTFNVIQNPPNYAVISLTNTPVTTSNFGPMAGNAGLTTYLPNSSIRQVDQNIQTAYAATWSLALQREVAKNTVASVEYSGSRGFQLYSLEDPNRLGSGVIYGGDNPEVDGAWSLLSPYYAVGSFRRENKGFSYYNGLTLKLQSDNLFNTGLMLLANYTYSHAIDNLSSTFSDSYLNYNTGLLDPNNPTLDKGSADFDVRHRIVVSGVWDVPFFKASSNGILKNVLGNWTLTPTITARTGLPYTLFDCTNGYYYCARVDVSGPVSISGNAGNTVAGVNQYNYLNYPGLPGDYANPITGLSEIGNCTYPGEGAIHVCPFPTNMLGRNTERMPGMWNVDMGIAKHIPIREGMKMDFSVNMFNMFNHPNLYVDNGTIDLSSSPNVTAYKADHRFIQFGLRLSF